MKGKGSGRFLARLPALALLAVLACASRPPHIPEREAPAPPVAPAKDPKGLAPGAARAGEDPSARLRMPPSRAGVLDLLSRFQSSIQSGQPPLGELLTESAGLTAPGTEASRRAPSRNAIVGALGASFADPSLSYDPFDVAVRSSEEGTVATVHLEPVAASSPRRVVLSLHLGYSGGGLRITDIALSRAP